MTMPPRNWLAALRRRRRDRFRADLVASRAVQQRFVAFPPPGVVEAGETAVSCADVVGREARERRVVARELEHLAH